MTILEALDDPQLFDSAFDEPAWRAFLAALFGLPPWGGAAASREPEWCRACDGGGVRGHRHGG